MKYCILFHSNFRQSYFASHNAKWELAFRGSLPSDTFSFMNCPFRAWNWHAPRWPDPGQLNVGTPKIVNGVPDAPISLQGSSLIRWKIHSTFMKWLPTWLSNALKKELSRGRCPGRLKQDYPKTWFTRKPTGDLTSGSCLQWLISSVPRSRTQLCRESGSDRRLSAFPHCC